MSDIVEDLRASHQNLLMASGGRVTESIYSRAADEIENQRRIVAELRGEA